MNSPVSCPDAPWISAVLISWNRRELLQKAVDSLRRQNYPNLEIIVVDNGSTDGSVEWMRSKSDIRRIENVCNRGASAARNQGTRIAKGDYILYMDSDAELRTENGLQRCVEWMESNPAMAGVAGVYYSDEELKTLWCWSPCMDWQGYFDPEASMKPKTDPPVLSTCFSMYRRSILHEVGGFDEYFFYLYEDGDLSDRLRKAGYRLHVDPSIKILHHYAEPGRTQRDQLDYHYYTERLRQNFLIKNWGVRRFLQSWKHKITHYKQIRRQFPYLSWLNYVDMYGIRTCYYLIRYIFRIRYSRKKWI
ncbi:MAG: glycosyltransferase family 2 protein [Candidatus Hinthialibacter sp.]